MPDIIFGDIMMMVGLNSLEDLHRSRTICQSWNVMISTMTKHKKHTIRRKAKFLAAQIRGRWKDADHTPLLPELVTAASLAHHGMLGSVRLMVLQDVDLASVPAEHLASLASRVTKCVAIVNVENIKHLIMSIMDSLKCPWLSVCDQTLGSEDTEVLGRVMSGVTNHSSVFRSGDLPRPIRGRVWLCCQTFTTDTELRHWATRAVTSDPDEADDYIVFRTQGVCQCQGCREED